MFRVNGLNKMSFQFSEMMLQTYIMKGYQTHVEVDIKCVSSPADCLLAEVGGQCQCQ